MNLTLAAPTGTTNTLLLLGFGTNTPLQVLDSCRVGPNAGLTLVESALHVGGGLVVSGRLRLLDGTIVMGGGGGGSGQGSGFTSRLSQSIALEPLTPGQSQAGASGLVLASGAELSGCGTISGNILSSGVIAVDCAGGLLSVTGAITNEGTIVLSNGASMVFGDTVVNHGVIDATDGEVVFLTSVVNTGTINVNTFSDADADGLPNGWESTYGLDPYSAGGRDGASGDPDRDGSDNLSEFYAGTNPTDAASVFRITGVELVDRDVRINFSTIRDRHYRVERADDLGSGVWTTVVDDLPGNGETMQVADPGAAAQGSHFYRVVLIPTGVSGNLLR